jgi:hypothetical protein
VLNELRGGGAGLRAAGGLLDDLRDRLPREFHDAPDAPAFDDPDWLRSVVDAAEALLRTRLNG